MPDAYEIAEAQFIQRRSNVSGADGLYARVGPVPEGKVWTILAACAQVSVAETQDFWFSVLARDANIYPVQLPMEFSINSPTNKDFPFVREGMEFKCFPGEYFYCFRDAATAGSTITLGVRFIESDLGFYEYLEPQEKKRLFKRATSALRSSGGVAVRSIPSRPVGGRGGPGRAEPV